jgi:transposase-like protein
VRDATKGESSRVAGRRSREFWKRIVAEVERGRTIARTAERHGVKPKTLAWWRWTLGRESAPVTKAQLLPVVFSAGSGPAIATSAEAIAIELRGEVTIRVPIGSEVSYVAALVSAVRATC